MQCYSELIPPCGVTHALYLPFTSADADNLIVARTSLLQVFQCKAITAGHDPKLVLVAEYNLAGTVTSLGRVKIADSKSGGDAVLLALRDAKLSLIDWDPALHSISTLSIHYYENHDLQSAPWQPDLADCVSRLTIDPSSRCAAFNFGISNLAIIPFHQAGDDLAMDDLDELDEEEKNKSLAAGHDDSHTNGATLPYAPSFVLPLTVLDPGLLHPIDMAFLHEYRDPTIGILYSTAARSSNMSPERKDVTVYAVYALDLEQKASTTLQAVQKLPNDLSQIIPLPLPVGGALLVGGNELIHIDQGGRSSAIAVNEFARDASSFSMSDQADARLKLEGCQVEHLGNNSGDMLVILSTGETALLTFRMDGRTVSGLSLKRIGVAQAHNLTMGAASCTANLGPNRLFIGSEEADSVMLGTDKKTAQLKRVRSRVQTRANGFDADDDEDDDGLDDDDDLYGEVGEKTNGHASNDTGGQNFRVVDRLPSLAPINDLAIGALGKRKREENQSSGAASNQLREIAVAYGRGHASGVAFISRQLEPEVIKRVKYDDAIGIWCFGSTENPRGHRSTEDLIMVSHMTADGVGRSSLYRLADGDMSPIADTDFDQSAGSAISVFQLQTTNHIIQVLPAEIRVYDADFGLSQIFPVVDEEEGQLARAVRASFAEPYLTLVKDDGTMTLLKADKAGELDEVGLPTALQGKAVLSASLFRDKSDSFQTSRLYTSSASAGPLLTLLTSDGHFRVLSLPNLALQVFQCDSLPFLPTYMLQNTQLPKHWRNKDDLAETLLVNLGNTNESRPFLVVRTTTNDIVIYEPFAVPNVAGSFKFKKITTKPAEAPEDLVEEEGEESSLQPMRVVKDIDGHASVFIPGAHPMLILREASTLPHIYELNVQNIKSLSAVNMSTSPHGFVFIDDTDHLCFSRFPQSLILGHSDWIIDRVPLHQDISSLTHFSPTDSYILATNEPTPFRLPQDDEWHPDWQAESTTFLPTTLSSSLKLLSSKSHRIVSQYHFDPSERILCVKTLNLEISEETHERKDLIVVGTALVKGENVTTRGNLYLFDVVDVVPEPELPETDLKLKLVTKEDVRGAVSAISGVGSQGFLLAAQGQKCMVRGLKEDMSILPVAFLDMRYYVHVAKELPGTGLCILGDAFSGLWLVGYSEEPYKLQILGRDLENPSVLAAEFLPDGKQLHIVSSDEDGVLRVLQYDPEDPKTERGAKLLLRSTFHTGTIPTTMTLLPPLPPNPSRTSERDSMDIDTPPPGGSPSILLTSQTGSLALITSLPESTYRRLSTLQNILLSSTLDSHSHFASLNPRAYRQIETDGIGGRGVIDGDLVRRWWEVSTQQKANAADKAGGGVWDVRADLGVVGGEGLGI
ncbi:mRNA cleavage and polyadenylation factor subunit [Cladophialophora chaetospira]|uniref:mRNA cleavage and polyadenylation factor subunit n=1 Tax=Cladophialophora chaetospira TaxID=386627 RepID=A0AA38XAY5_9EURO|nr:mRNA cleavage and polyadenylation factor subunit [Cladophialophora chaetospira]